MKLEEIDVNLLIPYENNPRKNDEAVPFVAASIREFGFKVPIIIDRNNVIVAGHTRLKAAKTLNMQTVPCIRADDLNEDQIRAFRIADNSVSEAAVWDIDKLNLELGEISLDMADFNVSIDVPDMDPIEVPDDDDGYYGDERERTNRAYNLDEVKSMSLSAGLLGDAGDQKSKLHSGAADRLQLCQDQQGQGLRSAFLC